MESLPKCFYLAWKNYMSNLRGMPLADIRSPLEAVEMLQFFRKWPQYLYWKVLGTYVDEELVLFFL